MNPPVLGESGDTAIPGVRGLFTGGGPTYVHNGGTGVLGHSSNGYGVHGVSEVGRGVVAESTSNYAIRAHSASLSGARCSSDSGVGVEGETASGPAGIVGSSQNTVGVRGISTNSSGILGTGKTGGSFEGTLEGVHAVSHHASAAGVAGYNDSTGPGIFGKSTHGAAGYFDGNVVVTGDVQLAGSDYAEDFDIIDFEAAVPGTVMVLDESGAVRVSDQAYDRRVAGIVSGAGDYKPAVILGRDGSGKERRPLALMGKVYCKVDATTIPIAVGDLLTTSSTPGHAMKAVDSTRAFGAVVGKALRSLAGGRGLVPVLVALQ